MQIQITFISEKAYQYDEQEESQTATLEIPKGTEISNGFKTINFNSFSRELFFQQYPNHPQNVLGYSTIYIQKIEAL